MRTVRWMSSVLALVALTPVVSAAQSNRLFENAWFWGAKAGLMNFSTGIETKTAPLVGAEWLITRNRAGTLSERRAGVLQRDGLRHRWQWLSRSNVALKDSRRYTAALLAFPVNWGSLRPYGGVGLALNLIQHATVDQSQVTDPDQEDVIARRCTRSATASPSSSWADSRRNTVASRCSARPRTCRPARTSSSAAAPPTFSKPAFATTSAARSTRRRRLAATTVNRKRRRSFRDAPPFLVLPSLHRGRKCFGVFDTYGIPLDIPSERPLRALRDPDARRHHHARVGDLLATQNLDRAPAQRQPVQLTRDRRAPRTASPARS